MSEAYQPPVSELLTLGEKPARQREWPDYLELGLTREHVPELLRMVADEEFINAQTETPAVYAPIHAWRALGQLQAEEAVEPLLELLPLIDDDWDWVMEELPDVYAMIGPAALPTLAKFLADPANGLWPRVTASTSIEKIGNAHPQVREQCISLLTEALARCEEQDPTLNGFIVSDLLDLKAVEAVDAIREAFRKGTVDQSIQGDFQDVEIELGLRERRTGAPRYYSPLEALQRGSAAPSPTETEWRNAGRNDPCPCGSGIKYKKCCLKKRAA